MNQGQKEGNDLNLYRQTYNKNNIVYKNILSTEKECKEMPQPAKNKNCLLQSEDKKDDIWQMYQEYAESALDNIKCNVMPVSNDYCDNKCCDNEISDENMPCPQKCCPNKPIQICDPNTILMQLDRMEKMLKEIYLCNQELCKSLVNYCCKYLNE